MGAGPPGEVGGAARSCQGAGSSPGDAEARTAVDLGGAKVASTARVTTLAADEDAVNTETDTPVTPVTSTFRGVAQKFGYTFPANSVTFLRIKQK